MNISSINNSGNVNPYKNVNFTGQKKLKNDMGDTVLQLTVPPHIQLDEGEQLGIELVSMINENKEGKYGWRIDSDYPVRIETDEEFKKGKKTYFNINLKDYWFDNAGEFGYRFIVTDAQGNIKRAFDDGIGTTAISKDNKKYTVVSTRQGVQHPKGAMEHIVSDSYGVMKNTSSKSKTKSKNDDTLPPMTKEEAEKFVRTHFNKAGGTIQNITDEIKEGGELSNYGYIMTTPLIGGGKVSYHGYHPENHFAITENTGTKKDFMDLQTTCFDSGIGYTLDGAFTSQGYEGIQLNHALKWKDSPFKDWFKVSKDNDGKVNFKLAVLPDSDNKYTGIRIVNPSGVEGVPYDSNKPSYIQFYDTRLASERQLSDSTKLIDAYDIKNTDDPYEITTHQDAVLPYYFEINPDQKPFRGKTNITFEELQKLNELHEIKSPDGTPYQFIRKGQQGGFTGWDGNVDLVKMNLSQHNGTKAEKEGSNQAKNYMYKVARYWTQETRNAIMMHIIDDIQANGKTDKEGRLKRLSPYFTEIENKYNLESGILSRIYANIEEESKKLEAKRRHNSNEKVDPSYNYKIPDENIDGESYVWDAMMSFPLESLNMSPELLGVLSTPYITPRPSSKGSPSANNNEIYEDAVNNTELSPTMQKVYGKFYSMLLEIMNDIDIENAENNNLSKMLLCGNMDKKDLTPYGKYFVSMAMNDIMTFFATESLFETGTYDKKLQDGKVVYTKEDFENGNYGSKKELTLKKLGINGADTPKAEAEQVAKKMLNGIKNLKEDKPLQYEGFVQYLKDEYLSHPVEDYKMAEAIVDQTGAGLNWRFDAAKDVADWYDVKDKQTISAQSAMDDVINFWKPFVKQVRDINPSSYIIGEITSLGDFDNYDWGKYLRDSVEEKDPASWTSLKPERVYYEETGVTTGSNYNVYFGLYPELFGRSVEHGYLSNGENGAFRSISNFMKKTNEFVNPNEAGRVFEEFIQQSHIFLDNHDKPRVAHLMAVDADLFWSNFKDNKQSDVERAEKYLQRDFTHKITHKDGTTEVKKMVDDDVSSKAVAVAEKYYQYFEKEGAEIEKDQLQIIKDAISHLANGYKYKTNEKEPDFKKAESFGSRPFEITIEHIMEQAKSMGLNPKYDTKELKDAVLKDMTEPYRTKQTAIWEMMTGTTGTPTLFAGDEYAQTGSERKSKNWDLGCRNLVRHDWVHGSDVKDYVVEFNTRLNAVTALHKQKGMQPLADGTPIVLSVQKKSEPNKPAKEEFGKKETADDLLEGAKKIAFNSNKNDALQNIRTIGKTIVEDAETKTPEQIIAELEKMDKDELKEKLVKRYKEIKVENEGLYDWIKQNSEVKEPNHVPTEVGGIYKYNDKNEAVLSVFTNAYIPENPESPLMEENNLKAKNKPKLSDIRLIDTKGRLADKPGTVYTKMSYFNRFGQYLESGQYVLQSDGTLKNKDGKDEILDSTVTFFRKEPEGKQTSNNTSFKGKKVYTSYSKPIG